MGMKVYGSSSRGFGRFELLSSFLRLGKNVAKRRSLLILYPRAIGHGYFVYVVKAQVTNLR